MSRPDPKRFDVFLSYNSEDRATVERIARALQKESVSVFLDRWNLAPGTPWVSAIEQMLNKSHSVAIFIGRHGLGAWQEREAYVCLDRQAKDPSFSVIPVLLPGSEAPDSFLLLNKWIDLRGGVDDPVTLEWLARSIQGRDDTPPPAVVHQFSEAPRVFLCHAKEDADAIRTVYFFLRDQGLDPWYDEEKLTVGDRWREEIIKAIEATDFFAIFLSKIAGSKSGFIQREIRTAIRQYQQRPEGLAYLLPVRLEFCDIPSIRLDENTMLTDLQWIDLRVEDDDSLGRLASGIRRQWRKINTSPDSAQNPTPAADGLRRR